MSPTNVRTAKEIAQRMMEGLPVHRPHETDRARTAREIAEDLLAGGKLYSGQAAPVWYHRFSALDRRGLEVIHLMTHWIASDSSRSKAFLDFVRPQLDGK